MEKIYYRPTYEEIIKLIQDNQLKIEDEYYETTTPERIENLKKQQDHLLRKVTSFYNSGGGFYILKNPNSGILNYIQEHLLSNIKRDDIFTVIGPKSINENIYYIVDIKRPKVYDFIPFKNMFFFRIFDSSKPLIKIENNSDITLNMNNFKEFNRILERRKITNEIINYAEFWREFLDYMINVETNLEIYNAPPQQLKGIIVIKLKMALRKIIR
ncbi:hypothetical protein KO465_05225 [Candidatus Micrarchaeota archaeon]|jgi:hypothetical protein|nr:hypothetical protein [Candidatus Micrarchaeota archaeon]